MKEAQHEEDKAALGVVSLQTEPPLQNGSGQTTNGVNTPPTNNGMEGEGVNGDTNTTQDAAQITAAQYLLNPLSEIHPHLTEPSPNWDLEPWWKGERRTRQAVALHRPKTSEERGKAPDRIHQLNQ